MKQISRREFLTATSLFGAGALVFGSESYKNIFARTRGFDLIIKNGFVIDGSGKREFLADIGIKDGKILAISKLNETDALQIIDVKGLKVVPGFIDIHSHTDSDLIINPKAESKIRQGVTTEITGQDGFSWGPIGGPELDLTLKNFKEEYGEVLNWRTIGDFLSDFSKRKFSVNIATMVGLGTVREFVVGLDDRPTTKDEILRMQNEVKKAIEEGAIGISTGLEYTPGSFASTEELIELCKAAPEFARIYSTHIRNEDNTVLEAIDEAIEIAKKSNSRLLISHLKVSGKSNWYKADAALEKIDKAIEEGLEVHADRYTYVAYHTNLSSLFPLWSRDGGTEKFLERLKDSSITNKIKEYVEKKVDNLDGDWNGVLISSVGKEEFKPYQGKTIKQISEDFGVDYFDGAVKVLLDAENQVMMMGFGMEEKSTEKILAHPRVMISSDAGSHAPYPPMNKSIAHPRAYGTFPRAIAKYVRERKICSLEEMIKKMTSMPADKLRFKDRGRLEVGKIADVVIFDYEKIQDKATFTEPHQYPDGIPYVIVNGEIVINNGEHTGAMPGQVIS
ncbi:MAG: D-aminoacylase [Ignavibacteria bacterium]|nr:D-aminoacylase [Ignavibacteria bacterium]